MLRSAIWMTVSFAALLAAGCQSTAPVNSCDLLRQPPALQSETRRAVIADRPVGMWIAAVDLDGRKAGCWK